MELKLLEKWMNDYENARFNQLVKTKELMNKYKTARKSQRTLDVNYSSYNRDREPVIIPEMNQYCCATITPNWKRVIEPKIITERTPEGIKYKTVETTVIVEYIDMDGVLYPEYVTGGDYWKMREKYNGYEQYLKANGCSMSDEQWLSIGRTEEDIKAKAHKDMLNQKKTIEQKVKKICGETLTNIDDTKGEIYVKGSNGRVAHIWAIQAGGYNIQCLHIRVLVKEIK